VSALTYGGSIVATLMRAASSSWQVSYIAPRVSFAGAPGPDLHPAMSLAPGWRGHVNAEL